MQSWFIFSWKFTWVRVQVLNFNKYLNKVEIFQTSTKVFNNLRNFVTVCNYFPPKGIQVVPIPKLIYSSFKPAVLTHNNHAQKMKVQTQTCAKTYTHTVNKTQKRFQSHSTQYNSKKLRRQKTNIKVRL